jgi:hypothetical protein
LETNSDKNTIVCSSCYLEKEANTDNFYWRNDRSKLQKKCKKCVLLSNEIYRQNNINRISEKQKLRYNNNKEKIIDDVKTYYANNKNKIDNYRNEYRRNKIKNDPNYKLRRNVSRAILGGLKRTIAGKNGDSILFYLKYTIEELRLYLESLWEPWMNWDNHGTYRRGEGRKWHIDHITPQSQLPYAEMSHDPESNFQKCWALSNLRPLDAAQNISKGCKI